MKLTTFATLSDGRCVTLIRTSSGLACALSTFFGLPMTKQILPPGASSTYDSQAPESPNFLTGAGVSFCAADATDSVTAAAPSARTTSAAYRRETLRMAQNLPESRAAATPKGPKSKERNRIASPRGTCVRQHRAAS